ncbi:MAG: amino acid permease [Simkaniaceae bacterium]|nr:amino acid permease [Simkaniaceae bacterium]
MSASECVSGVNHATEEKTQFGTFAGVFLPSILPILGVILFLRMGYFVGISGLKTTLLLILSATTITFITALSISSTATNMRAFSGGIYHLLSRTFGVEVGSTIGIPLFLAQTINIAFYIAGFSEALHLMLPKLPVPMIGVAVLIAIVVLSFTSTKRALKTQIVIFIIVLLALASFFIGAKILFENVEISPSTSLPSPSFWILFALFFPAVTGIESGFSMSGDLKNPTRSLPLGTISAVVIGFVIYIALAFSLYYIASQETLISAPMILKDVALIKGLVLLGILGATFSGALSSLLAAPRTLQALVRDKVLPKFLCKESGSDSSPKFAILVTSFFVFLGMMLGGLNTLAPLLTMFFLISYGMLNFATAVESMLSNPSWRPTLKVHFMISFFGAAMCLFCMMMISVSAGILATIFLIITYFILKKREITSNWDDIRSSILLLLSRFAIYRLAHAKPSAKSWRPHLLVFIGDPFLRAHLVDFTRDITHSKGLLTMASIVDHDFKANQDLTYYRNSIDHFLKSNNVPSLVEVHRSTDVMEGMKTMIHHYGFGPLTPNTIVLGATLKPSNFTIFAEVIKLCQQMKKNVIIIRENNLDRKAYNLSLSKKNKHIDVWWGGRDRVNSDLILVLAYMLQTSKEWKGSTLSLKTVATDTISNQKITSEIKEFSRKSRLHIQSEIITTDPKEDLFQDTIYQSSKDANLLFLGMRAPKIEESTESYVDYYASLLERTAHFPPVAFVLSFEDVNFSEILN